MLMVLLVVPQLPGEQAEWHNALYLRVKEFQPNTTMDRSLQYEVHKSKGKEISGKHIQVKYFLGLEAPAHALSPILQS